MKKSLVILLALLLLCVNKTWGADGDKTFDKMLKLIDNYEESSSSGKLDVANKLFKDVYAEIADSVYVFGTETNTGYLDAMVYYWGAEYAYDKGQFAEGLKLVNTALPLMEKYAPEVELSDCYSLAGIISQRLGDFAKAVEYMERVLRIDRKSGDKERVSSSLNNLAVVYLSAGDVKSAERFIREAIEMERSLDRPATLAVRLGKASEILLAEGRANDALPFAEEALTLEQRSGKTDKVCVRKSQLAAVLIELGREDEARTLLLEAKAGLEKEDNIQSLAITLNQLASLELKRSSNAKAVEYLNESLKLCKTTGNIYTEAKVRHMLYEALKQSNPQEAMRHLEAYSLLNDSLYNGKTAEQLQLFNVKYDTAEKQHQIELQQEQLTQHRVWLVIAIIIVVLAVVVAVLLWRLASARGRANKLLVQANLAKDRLIAISKEEKMKAEEAREKIREVANDISEMGEMPDIKLTKREKQIVTYFCQGKLSKEIADELNISQRTVETHKLHIYRKIGVNNTVELLGYARKVGLMD